MSRPSLQSSANPSFSIAGQKLIAPPLEPGLYLVATPIGNLKDITLRALEVMASADLIACEDTRVSKILLNHYGIQRPLTPYHDHNAARERPRLLELLMQGARIALISDAGTPLIADPGYKLVEAALAQGSKVVPVPGPSALLTALTACGLPTDTFVFLGFLPPKSTQRRKRLASFGTIPATLLFYESPSRVSETLDDMIRVLGSERQGALARELTKHYEDVRRGTLAALAAGAASDPPRGEIVLIVAPPSPETGMAEDIDALLSVALAEMSAGQAAAEIAKITGKPRREIYTRALVLKGLTRER